MKSSFLFFILLGKTYAAGGGHSSGHVSDLLFPGINFVILMSLLIWKIKSPLREMLDKNADDVKNLFELAEKKDKEANLKVQMVQEKLDNLGAEKTKIMNQAQKQAESFIQKTQAESADYISRITKDVDNKISHEKNVLINEMSSTLVDEVINKAKSTISTNSDYKKKATDKLISGIQ